MDNVIILFGFIWMLLGSAIGLYVGNQHEQHLQRLEDIAEGGSLVDFNRTLDAYKRKVTIHTHSMLFSLVAVAIGVVFPRLAYSEAASTVLGLALIVAGPLWTLGAARSLKPVMGLGDVLLAGSIAATIVGLAPVCWARLA